ncbi:ribbon-helix-helix domain-containing protein [Caballeronia mineralivorans]|nr:ribbon-helix-helix domain-containing protein [Caballeronia mineralivorans]
MKRTHIFFPEPMVARLKVLSAKQGQSMAELIRTAILALFEKHGV